MISDKHREAEELSVAAAQAVAEGRNEDAKALYAQAAECEKAALARMPRTKVHTRSILSVSVASLLYKAQLLARAEETITRLILSRELEPWADKQVKELLGVVMKSQDRGEETEEWGYGSSHHALAQAMIGFMPGWEFWRCGGGVVISSIGVIALR
jgi:hypothetical protein